MASMQMAKVKTTRVKSKLKYSAMELRVLDLLSKGKVITSTELVENLYDGEHAPHHARHSVTSILASLMRKVEHNKEPFKITKSQLSGPYPSQYKKVRK